MDWDLLRYFRAVSLHNQLGAAAKATGASVATVSRKIAELERTLGKPLLVRDGRGYRLSEFGRRLALRVEKAGSSLEEAIAEFESQELSRSQSVRLSSVESLATFWLPDQIGALFEHEPNLDIDIRSDFSLVDPRLGDADIVLRLGKRGSGPLVGRMVGLAAYGLFTAPGHQRMVRYPGSMGDTPLAQWAKSTFDVWHGPAVACDNLSSAVNILAAAGGVAVLPAFIARSRGWRLLEPKRALYTEILILRSPSFGRNDPRSQIYRRLVDLLKSFDFLSPIPAPAPRRVARDAAG